MKIIKTEKGLIIDGMNKATVYVKENENIIEMIGFDNEVNIEIHNFNFITVKTKYYFGQDITVSGLIYKYIGIDKQKNNIIFWDTKNEVLIFGNLQEYKQKNQIT